MTLLNSFQVGNFTLSSIATNTDGSDTTYDHIDYNSGVDSLETNSVSITSVL